MALGFSVTLSEKERLGSFPCSLEIERVLHALENIPRISGFPTLLYKEGSAARPTFTASYLKAKS